MFMLEDSTACSVGPPCECVEYDQSYKYADLSLCECGHLPEWHDVYCESNGDDRILGVFRWRGAWNWKDITERIVAGIIAGLAAGLSFWVMERMFG